MAFVATTPFAVNAFLRSQLLLLAKTYDVTLCVNTSAYPLEKDIQSVVRVQHIDIGRKISPWQDLRAFVQLLKFLYMLKPDIVHSMTPKAGLLTMFAGRLGVCRGAFIHSLGRFGLTKRE